MRTLEDLHIHYRDEKVTGVETEGQIYFTSLVIINPLLLADSKVEKVEQVRGF